MCECKCPICTRHKKIDKLIDEKNVNGLTNEIINLLLLLETVETDLERCQAILKGNWPQSVQILEKALKNAKKKMD